MEPSTQGALIRTRTRGTCSWSSQRATSNCEPDTCCETCPGGRTRTGNPNTSAETWS
ncbi:hypothetical protein BC826DRAFT_1032588, partial [Russula brevipes]